MGSVFLNVKYKTDLMQVTPVAVAAVYLHL